MGLREKAKVVLWEIINGVGTIRSETKWVSDLGS